MSAIKAVTEVIVAPSGRPQHTETASSTRCDVKSARFRRGLVWENVHFLTISDTDVGGMNRSRVDHRHENAILQFFLPCREKKWVESGPPRMYDGEVLPRRKSQPEDDVTVHHVHQKLCGFGSMFSFRNFATTLCSGPRQLSEYMCCSVVCARFRLSCLTVLLLSSSVNAPFQFCWFILHTWGRDAILVSSHA